MTNWKGYALLVDMDGVIISLKARWIDPFEYAITKVKPDVDKQAILDNASSLLLKHGGRSKKIWIRGIQKICKIAKLNRWQTYNLFLRIGFMLLTRRRFKIIAFEGVEQTLQEIKDMGIKLALVTTASDFTKRRLKRKYPQIYNKYDAVFTRNDVKLTKPSPDQLLLALDKIGAEPSKSVMVGDFMTDIIAGQNAGVKTVAVLSEFPLITEFLLESVMPDMMIESFNDIPKVLPQLFKDKKPEESEKHK